MRQARSCSGVCRRARMLCRPPRPPALAAPLHDPKACPSAPALLLRMGGDLNPPSVSLVHAQLSAAVISYLGAFTASYRDDLIAGWTEACKKVGMPWLLRVACVSPQLA